MYNMKLSYIVGRSSFLLQNSPGVNTRSTKDACMVLIRPLGRTFLINRWHMYAARITIFALPIIVVILKQIKQITLFGCRDDKLVLSVKLIIKIGLYYMQCKRLNKRMHKLCTNTRFSFASQNSSRRGCSYGTWLARLTGMILLIKLLYDDFDLSKTTFQSWINKKHFVTRFIRACPAQIWAAVNQVPIIQYMVL
jgi:hypothetical protein